MKTGTAARRKALAEARKEDLLRGMYQGGADHVFLDERSKELATDAVKAAAKGDVVGNSILTAALIRHHMAKGRMGPDAERRAITTIIWLERRAMGGNDE